MILNNAPNKMKIFLVVEQFKSLHINAPFLFYTLKVITKK